MKFTLLQLNLIFFLAFNVLSASAQDVSHWYPQLAANRTASSDVKVKNKCQATHEFELIKGADMTWLDFVRGSRVRVGPGEEKPVHVSLNTTGMEVGLYESQITVRCVDCALDPTCKAELLNAHLKVLWPKEQLESYAQEQFIPNQVLLILPLTKENERKRIVREFETKYQLKQLKVYDLNSLEQTLVVFSVLNPNLSVAQAVLKMQEEAAGLYAQPNFIYQTAAVEASSPTKPDDPYVSRQYGLKMIGADRVNKYSTGSGVRVAIIDTGIDYNHVDLKGRVIDRTTFVEDDKSFAENIHGTMVAGIIAAKPNNGAGIHGAAPNVGIIAIKAFKPRHNNAIEAEGSTVTLSRALDYAIARKVQVINLSIGGPYDPGIKDATRNAYRRGITLVAAAGNDGTRGLSKYPAALDHVIAVSAIDSLGHLYWSATRGDFIDLAAPGIEVMSTSPGNRFNVFTGTSVAAPHVSAAVALLLQHNPKLTPSEIKSLLESAARDLGQRGKDNDYGNGAVDVCKAFERVTKRAKLCG